METALHRELKERFGADRGGRSEVSLEGFRIDAVDASGGLIEVQSGALGPLRRKLSRLLAEHRVRVVKPVVLARRIVRRDRPDGPDLSSRLSPKRGALLDVFEDLVGLARIFPHENLTIDVMGVEAEEVRIPRRRRPGYRVVDRRLRGDRECVSLARASDLWKLIPAPLPSPFTTLDLADALGRPVGFAQKIAYCLRLSGAAEAGAKLGNRLVYRRQDPGSADE